MKTHLIEAGNSVIKVEIADDHIHLHIMSPSYHDEELHVPAESAWAMIDAETLPQLIEALQSLKVKPTLKSVERH